MNDERDNGITEMRITERGRQMIDQANSHSDLAHLITLAGGHYNGIMQLLTGSPLVLFTDPQTKSTMALRLPECTIENVCRKIQNKRAEFNGATAKGDRS